ncbi:EF-hand domain-containing protein [Colwellia sp. D2M02]|uniref:EF-hand domain-containing protein n=1 Tax=Colwellia sp. D2M02 TaxID=2841562 RepID=UPI001C098481|nr:EF-hand domain-containing protein [Colwellia sp. D2M02]MBU2891829.1 EF-hand domain-containing protein [Colwellia sp. D2M02]
MKKTALTLFSTCFMLSATAATDIENEKYRWLAQYDSNQDYTIDVEELYSSRATLFEQADKNQDKVIDANEHQQFFERNLQEKIDYDRKQSIKQTHVRFNAMDKNDNNLMSYDEYMATAKRSFDFYDTDKSGIITLDDKKPTFTSTKKSTLTDAEKAEKKRKRQMRNATRVVRMPTTHSKSGMLVKYDLNDDQQITWAEYQQKRNLDFARADENGDKDLTNDEYVAEFEDRLDTQIAKIKAAELNKNTPLFASLDKNNNQQISVAEFQLNALVNFTYFDTDNNGQVSFEEAVNEQMLPVSLLALSKL